MLLFIQKYIKIRKTEKIDKVEAVIKCFCKKDMKGMLPMEIRDDFIKTPGDESASSSTLKNGC